MVPLPALRPPRRQWPTTALTLILLVAQSGSVFGRPAPEQGSAAVQLPNDEAPTFLITGFTSGSPYDTSWYGGTVWAADSNRWEAIPGGTWTFDSGVGSAIQNAMPEAGKPNGYHRLMEGWEGYVRGGPSDTEFRRSTTCAIAGSYSMWVGKTLAEASASCWGGGQGYGNNLDATLEQTFAYGGAGNVTLQFSYAVDSEAGYDDLTLAVRPSGASSDVILATYDGLASGMATFTLRTIDGTLPAGAGTVTIRFLASSDGSYSDQDGYYPTACGLAAVDNIQLSGAITHLAGFESSTDGWTVPTSLTIDDFSNLEDVANLSPPTNFLCNDCGVRDSAVVFIDTNGQHPVGQGNAVVSPWIDLKAGGDVGRPNLFVTFDAYSGTNTPVSPNLAFGVQYYPWVCPTTGLVGVSPPIFNNAFFYFGAPTCGRVTYSGLGGFGYIAPPGAEQLRIFLGPHGYLEPNTDSGPWFDNIRVGTFGPTTAPNLLITTSYRFQDNFATDGTLNPASTARIDTGNYSIGAAGSVPGDTLAVTCGGTNVEVRFVFRIQPGPFLDAGDLAIQSARWTPEPGIGPAWYSARMDTAERNGSQSGSTSYRSWMTAFHESDPGFIGTDRTPDPSNSSQLANDILPDNLLTPGSRLDYFIVSRYIAPDPRDPGGNSRYIIPDTTGGAYWEMEVLPSSMTADTTWNCVLLVDGHEHESSLDHEREEDGLRYALGPGGTNAEQTRFDRMDIMNSSGLRLGRPATVNTGATLTQLSAYRRVLWYGGTQSSGAATAPGTIDIAVLDPWLKSTSGDSRGFWLNGAESAGRLDSGVTRAFLNGTLGVSYTCGAIRSPACPSGSLLDLTWCLPLTAAATPAFTPSSGASLSRNGCPTPVTFNLINTHASVATAAGNLRYVKNGTPTNFASVTVNTPPGYAYRTVVDAFPVAQLRRTPSGDPNDPAQCTGLTPIYERTLDVLRWLGTPDCPTVSLSGTPDPIAAPTVRPFLGEARPNPATGATRITFAVSRNGVPTRIDLFDVTGRLVRTLVDRSMDAGRHEVTWDGHAASGAEVGAGLYFYRMVSESFVETRKLVIVK